MFLEQVKDLEINPDEIDSVFLTHAHKDAIGGLEDLDKWIGKKINVYVPEGVNVFRFSKEFKNLNIVNLKPYEEIEIGDYNITPFRVIHYEYHPTLGKKFPTYGYRINNVVYAEDMEAIPEKSIKYFKNADTIIADGTMWFGKQIRGHLSIDKTLLLAKKFQPNNLIIIQAGRTYPNQSEALVEIKKFWDSIKGDTETNIYLSYDGMRFNANELRDDVKLDEGIYLPEPHARLIREGEKKLIIKEKEYPNMVGKPLFYMDDKYAYGILRLKKPKKISLKEFGMLKQEHKITDEERIKWWNGANEFYAYEFDILSTFEEPKPIELPKGVQTFVESTKFLSEDLEETGSGDVGGGETTGFGLQPIWIWGRKKKGKIEVKLPSKEVIKLIQKIETYDPTKVNNAQLADDWRIVNGWYSTYIETEGKGIKFSKETIINLAKLIYQEIVKRVKEGKMKHEFKPEKMKPHSRELYRIVSGESVIMAEWRDLKFLENLQDFTVIKDCISLIGSSVTQEHKPHDIDLLIRFDEPKNDFLKRAIEVRIAKMLPEELQDKVHFVWGEKEGPHDSFIPLYDLCFRKINPPKVVVMNENKIKLMEPYVPQKPLGSAYYDIDKFIEALL